MENNKNLLIFKNISCLRLRNNDEALKFSIERFKNISCLRLSFRTLVGLFYCAKFKNISCLRLSAVFSSFIRL